MNADEQIKGSCSKCDGHIQFPPGALGQTITCPHCGTKTQLRDPSGGTPVVQVEEVSEEGDKTDALKSGLAGLAKAASQTARKAADKAREIKDSDELKALKDRAGQAVSDAKDKAAAEARANPAGFKRKLVIIGAVIAVVALVALFKSGSGGSAFEKALANAESGDADAQHQLGGLYLAGEGTEKSMAEAVKWYTAATEQDHVDALVTLGSLHLQGLAPGANATEGFRLFKLAADTGDESAQSVVGELYWRGQGTGQDFKEALKWLKESDAQPNSQFYLGLMHARGEGVERDVDEAIDLLDDAADGGIAEAHGALGHIYATDPEEKDEKKAARGFERGSEAGSAQSTHLLGLCHLEGFGVRTDKTLALNLVEEASSKGCREAENSLRQMDNTDAPSQLQHMLKMGSIIFDPARRNDSEQDWEKYRR